MITCTSPAIFLSDCHLPLIPDSRNEKWAHDVVMFLRNEAMQAKTIFLVGDIFDFWFEWRHSVPSRAFPVLAALHDLVLAGSEVHYLAGNHDGHPGQFLRDEVGLKVTRSLVDAEIDGKRFHIIHGDGVALGDKGYRMLRLLVRWKPTEVIYKLVHPDFGIWFARQVSRSSRDHLSKVDKFGLEPYKEYAFKKLDSGFNYVVMGHRHKAGLFEHPNGAYAAIGDWINEKSYGYFCNDKMELKYFKR